MSPSGRMGVTSMHLVGNAEAAALELVQRHPDMVFTSGMRSVREQSCAMAQNVVLAGRGWIRKTYKYSTARVACQDWLDANPDKVTDMQIADGLEHVLEALPPSELLHISKHLVGLAFDVKPVSGMWGGSMLGTIRQVVGKHGGTFLEKEGGLTRWHCQFDA